MKEFRQILIWFLCLGMFFGGNIISANAQSTIDTAHHKVLMGGIVFGKDTFPLGYIPIVFITAKIDPARRAYLDNLRYNVAKVYPYAVAASYVIKQVDQELDAKQSRHDRKAYIKATQKALDAQFKGELKNLTITQGQILVKLINRETGKNCYDVIKELRGGLNARIFQTMAFFFNNNLKAQYDPYGKDRDIEMIVQEIEDKSYYQTQSKILEQRTALGNSPH